MERIKNIAREFVPPIAVSTAKRVMESVTPNARQSPFKYLPNDIDPKWIMDIGANEGTVARAALRTFSNANIICFEPVHDTYTKLVENMAELRKENPKRKICLEQIALANYNGESEINITNFHPANSLIPQSKYYSHYNPSVKVTGTQKVKVSRLDDIRTTLPSRHFDIVKIDVEGLEKEVLKGGALFFQNYVDIIIVEVSFQRQDENNEDLPQYLELLNMLNQWKFKLINIYDVENLTYNYPNKIMNDMMVVQMDCVFRKVRSKP